MKALSRHVNTSSFVPDYTATSLFDVDFEALAKRGVRFVAIDADSTLVPFRGTVITPELRTFLEPKLALFDGWCIATNRVIHDLSDLAASIDAPLVQGGWWIRKPHRKFYQRITRLFNAPPETVAMIGDKLFADMWGAKRAGLVTVWVERLGTDAPWDRLFRTRRRERKILNHYVKRLQIT